MPEAEDFAVLACSFAFTTFYTYGGMVSYKLSSPLKICFLVIGDIDILVLNKDGSLTLILKDAWLLRVSFEGSLKLNLIEMMVLLKFVMVGLNSNGCFMSSTFYKALLVLLLKIPV